MKLYPHPRSRLVLLREGRPLVSFDLQCSENRPYSVHSTPPCDLPPLPCSSKASEQARISAFREPLHPVNHIQST